MMGRSRLTLHDGAVIPQLGLGLLYVDPHHVPDLIVDAAALGYRHFDTATHYGNESAVGEGIRRLDLDRDALFVTTKLPNAAHGYDETLRAFDASETAIGRIDLYLIHWPQPSKGRYRECWRALVRLQQEGRVRSIGVANFTPALMDEIVADTGVWPVINQIELHPAYQQDPVRAYHDANNVLIESWSPLGHGKALRDPTIVTIAARLGRTPAQVILAWHLQSGLIAIPKAADRRHLADNVIALDVALGDAEMAEIAGLDDTEGRFGPDPLVHFT